MLPAVAALLILLVACNGAQGTVIPDYPPPTTSSSRPEATAVPNLPGDAPPLVDTDIHSVPLRDVIFDTFNGGYLRLSEASSQSIESLRDVIRPIYQPHYDGPEGGAWLKSEDLIIGYVGSTDTYAYPVKMLNLHEIVNDEIYGVPILVTYCPLCASGVVFHRRLSKRVLLFGNTSALFENDLVMFDHQTGSYWYQVGGEAIVGTLTGKRLTPLPSVTMPWGQWRELYPDTRILSQDQGFKRPLPYSYDQDLFETYGRSLDSLQFPFPVSTDKLDDRLQASALVLTVIAGGQEKAYPLESLGDAVVNDNIGGEPLVIFSRGMSLTASAFSPRANGKFLTFELHNGQILDRETGSRWDHSGRAIAGAFKGAPARAPAHTARILVRPVPGHAGHIAFSALMLRCPFSTQQPALLRRVHPEEGVKVIGVVEQPNRLWCSLQFACAIRAHRFGCTTRKQ